MVVLKTGLTAKAQRTQRKPLFYLVLLLLPLSGCSKTETVFIPGKPSSEKGSVVYIYRPDSFSNVVISPNIIIDENKQFAIGNNQYTYVHLKSGVHTIKIDLDEHYQGVKEISVKIEQDKIYYLRIDTTMKFKTGEKYLRSFSIQKVSDANGSGEIRETRYIKPAMPSRYLFGDDEGVDSQQKESVFSIEKTNDPFRRELM